MSDNKKAQNEKRNKTFREKVVDQFPEDFKPDYKPKEFDALNDSGKVSRTIRYADKYLKK